MYVSRRKELVMEKKNDVENKKEFWTEFCEILRTDEMRHWFSEFKKNRTKSQKHEINRCYLKKKNSHPNDVSFLDLFVYSMSCNFSLNLGEIIIKLLNQVRKLFFLSDESWEEYI